MTVPDYPALFSLKGKTALVTGGTSGLGHAIAAAFLAAGADVAVCGGNPSKAEDLKDLAGCLGRSFLAIRCDVTDADSVESLLDAIATQWGRLHILVNSAGKNRLIPAEDYDVDAFKDVLGLNIVGLHLITSRTAKRFMIPAGYGRILNISSVKSFIGTDTDYCAYCASKGAVNMYTRQLACEWAKYQITCNAIAPTFVPTPINSFQLEDPAFFKKITSRIPLGRIGKTQDIAAAALYLCSDAASFVNGQILAVDGGLTAMQ